MKNGKSYDMQEDGRIDTYPVTVLLCVLENILRSLLYCTVNWVYRNVQWTGGTVLYSVLVCCTVQCPVVGVLDEPDSTKPAQRSSFTGPPGYIGMIGWTRFQPMKTGGHVRLLC